MKVFCISNDIETAVGLKLTGVNAEVIKDREEILAKINEIKKNEDIGVLILTDSVYKKVENEVEEIRDKKKLPLIVTIPEQKNI